MPHTLTRYMMTVARQHLYICIRSVSRLPLSISAMTFSLSSSGMAFFMFNPLVLFARWAIVISPAVFLDCHFPAHKRNFNPWYVKRCALPIPTGSHHASMEAHPQGHALPAQQRG